MTNNQCKTQCKICNLISPSKTIEDERGTRYRLLPFDCKATNAIYIIECTLCKEYYIGMTTTTVRQRISNHLSSIRNGKNTSTARHFCNDQHNVDTHFKVGILDRDINSLDETKIREGVWIGILDSVNNGLNERNELLIQLDYQIFTLFKHFNHSHTCLPYLTAHVNDVRTLNLNTHRRTLIPRRTRARTVQCNDQR
jgi:hypothetical protein